MNIVWHEIKKIWNWKILLLIAAMCGLLFLMFMEFSVSIIRGTRITGSTSDFVGELTERFGSSVTETEMEAFFEETYAMLVAEANEHIRRIPIFAEAGVYSYADFREIRDMSTERNNEMFDVFAFSEETNGIGLRLRAFDLLASNWDSQVTLLEYQISREYFTWVEELFVNAINAAENSRLAEFTAEQRAVLEAEANEHINRLPIFAVHGITNYAEFTAFAEQGGLNTLEHRERSRVIHTLTGAEGSFVERKLYRVDFLEFVLRYDPAELRIPLIEEALQNHRHFYALTENEHRRMTEILESGEYRNIMGFHVFYNATSYVAYLALMIMLAVLLLISPLLATDKMRNIHSVQYSTKIGRKLMYRQFVAAMVSALMLAIILTAIFSGIFYTSGVTAYWNHGTVSFLNGALSLFPLTLGNLLIIMVAMAWVLGVVIACVAFILSRYSRNILTALFKIIPITVALFFLNRAMLGGGSSSRPFSFWNSLYRITRITGTEVVACALLLVIAFAAAIWVSRRERRAEVK